MGEGFKNYPNNRFKNWIAFRDSETFKSGIMTLEAMHIGIQDKVAILATALNIKKASTIDFNPEVATVNTELMFSQLGLFFSDVSAESVERISSYLSEEDEFWKGRHFYIIAATLDDLEMALEHAKQVPDDRVLFGQAVDYPETSTVAFEDYLANDEDTLMQVDHPEFTVEEKAFTFFRLSKQNWEQEIIWLEQIIAAVKTYSPEIYKQVMISYHRSK